MSRVNVLYKMTILSLVFNFGFFVEHIYAQEPKDSEGGASNVFELDTVTVTAEKREKDVQTVPSSVTVIGETQIDDFNLRKTTDLISLTPNLYITRAGNSTAASFASMRGISGAMTGNPTLGIYVDDVAYPGVDFSLYDIERIEVLRGPQGTLYGRNAEAGVINIITKKPSSEWEGKVSLEGGDFNSYGFEGGLSGPLWDDRVGLKAVLRYMESDGYFENQFDGSDDAGSMENLDGRLTLTSAPTEKLDLTLTADLQNYDSPKYAHFSPLDYTDMRKDINVDYPGETNKDAGGISLRGEYQFSDMTLVSITSARIEDFFLTNDIDFMPIDLMTFNHEEDVTSYAQELRLVSGNSESSLQWLAGLYLLDEEKGRDFDIWMNFMNMGMGVPGETLYRKSNTTTLGAALFGEATYSFGNGIDLTFGLRYDREELDFDYSQEPSGPMLEMMGSSALTVSNDDTFDAWLPKAAINFHFSENIMPYFTISRGFRSGGFNDVGQAGTPYSPEFTWNYELGAKTSWWDNKLRLNAALFYIDRTDMLVEVIAGDGISVYVDNAAEASSMGAELELSVRPLRGLELVASAAYTEAEYDEYTQGVNVLDGNRVTDAPEYTFNFGATYRHDSGFFLNVLYSHIGEIYFDAANTTSQDDYGLLDAKIGYEAEHFDIYVYGNNLFDEDYVTRAFDASSAGDWYGRAGVPQTFGIMLQRRF